MRRLGLVATSVFILATAAEVRADAALFVFGGASTGGNITVLSDSNFDLETAFENSPIFGARVGSYGFPFGFEGTIAYSRANLTGDVLGGAPEVTTNIFYAEANLLVIVLPGPVAPFVTGGFGLHYLDFNIGDFASLDKSKFGYNFGGGVLFNVARVGLRFDVRDHVTTFGLGDFGLGFVGGLIGLADSDARIHNVEVSFGLGFRF
ncbi:MAG TPA: hypothetical protein VEK15_09805 [Vicinamibacteria bacterium]|nr:hypothetical protein [Vicinamibacteria bacterium]